MTNINRQTSSARKGEVCGTREAAELLGVSLRTVQLWVERGDLHAWKTQGGHRRVSVASVNALLAERGVVDVPTDPVTKLIKVLIVEDDKALRKLYEATIRKWNIPVHIEVAKDGFEALVAIGAHKPDIIITDISMPGMDGIAMLRKLKEHHDFDDIEIIVVTGMDAARIEQMGGVPEGISVFLKPAPFALIQARIQEIANHKLGGIYA
jgi:excisionase family DNA binding protein